MKYKYAAYTNVVLLKGEEGVDVGAVDEETAGLIAYSNNLSNLKAHTKREFPEDEDASYQWRGEFNGASLDDHTGTVVCTLVCIYDQEKFEDFDILAVIVKDPEQIPVV